MSELYPSDVTHPKGEITLVSNPNTGSWPVDTPGGRVQAEWCDDAPVTREGSLIFFFQFLEAGGRWEQLIKNIPLRYQSNHASDPRDVIGTLFLSVLNGHWRCVHINSIRGDGVNPDLLGMGKTVSEDVVRRALKKMDEPTALHWLETQNREAITPILFLPWILDIDNDEDDVRAVSRFFRTDTVGTYSESDANAGEKLDRVGWGGVVSWWNG